MARRSGETCRFLGEAHLWAGELQVSPLRGTVNQLSRSGTGDALYALKTY